MLINGLKLPVTDKSLFPGMNYPAHKDHLLQRQPAGFQQIEKPPLTLPYDL
jgi:hypothetical protein